MKTINKFLATIALCSAITSVASASNTAINVPEFVNGINDNDVSTCYQNTEKFCNKEKNSGNWTDYKQCITPYMQKETSCVQPLALQNVADSMYSTFTKTTHYQPVDVVEATTIMADKSNSILLVGYNGDVIDVDNFIIDLKTAKIKNYAAVAKKYPHMEQFDVLYPPAVQHLPNGIIRFVFKREVHDGCRACANVAYAKMAFDFNKDGKFLGAKILTLLPVDVKK